MDIVAIVSADAVTGPVECRAFRPSAYVEFVQVVALIALFAQTFQPVLADQVVGVRVSVFVGTGIS